MSEKFSNETESMKESNILESKNSINEKIQLRWLATDCSKLKNFRVQGLSFEILFRFIIKE